MGPYYIERTGLVTPWEFFSGVLMILLVLEATRRSIGRFLPLLVVIFLLYAIFGRFAPGIFVHKGYGLSRLVGTLYLGNGGIYGLPMEFSATYVIMFVMFGMLLMHSGGDRWFIDLSYTLTGRLRGGPALSSILSSGIMGMLTGSPVANVVTTGNFTIPLMKRAGFRPHMAGAIEAVASTGGMFTPPLMGAGAFLIAEFLSIPYVEVAQAAVPPAALFFLSLMAVVYFTAWREDLGVHAEESMPRLGQTLIRYGHMSPPPLDGATAGLPCQADGSAGEREKLTPFPVYDYPDPAGRWPFRQDENLQTSPGFCRDPSSLTAS